MVRGSVRALSRRTLPLIPGLVTVAVRSTTASDAAVLSLSFSLSPHRLSLLRGRWSLTSTDLGLGSLCSWRIQI